VRRRATGRKPRGHAGGAEDDDRASSRRSAALDGTETNVASVLTRVVTASRRTSGKPLFASAPRRRPAFLMTP
jgi:hypothetical protein